MHFEKKGLGACMGARVACGRGTCSVCGASRRNRDVAALEALEAARRALRAGECPRECVPGTP